MEIMDYITTEQAAEILGISRIRVLAFINDGRLKAERAGRAWLILKSDLDDFAKQPRTQGWKKGRPRKEVEG
jgi:excisionase family DNA binding protein